MLIYSKEDHKYMSVKEEGEHHYIVFTDESCTKTKRITKRHTLTVAPY